MPPYWLTAREIAKTETKRYNLYKAVPSALAGIVVGAIRMPPMKDIFLPVGAGVGMYALLHAGEYLYNLLIVAPARIYADHQKEIRNLTAELETIRRDKAADFNQRVAESTVTSLSHAGKAVLRYLWNHHKINWSSDLTFYDLHPDTIWRTLTEELRRSDLVTQHIEPAAIGKNEKIWWEITPGYKPALGNLLFF